jgi:uncharacterized protein YndB with AHSA1/START domain
MNPLTLVVKRTINAPCHKVFEAWSKPEIMQQWFFPPEKYSKAKASNDFKVGGHLQLEMLAKDGSSNFSHSCEYKEIIPNKKIVFTWSSHLVSNTLITVELREIGNQTETTLTHELFPNADLCNRHRMGWEGCLDNLTQLFLEKISSTTHCNC